ncbi:glycosyltransferase [Plebeiibacterium sediminum]|uniref:Glycosyltransferase n=1 Tax=Plebeiibacterium sediminum TaxID=2992112 RepID=A0AAE3SE20_9BACT|nr:glycosyltransferase [Plebeiobacterium sediminum]MCW3785522.1 glycosyltransferase [Plebeiobacterium sediminum]
MKITFFTHSLNIGGVTRVFVNQANELHNKGYDVDFVICNNTGELLNELNRGINLIHFGNRRITQSFFYLIKYIKKNKPNYIITGSNVYNEYTILANMISGGVARVIATQGNYFDIELKSKFIYGRYYKWFMKLLYPKAYKVIAVSEGIKSLLEEFLPKKNILRIYNSFDKEDIESKSFISTYNQELIPEKYIFVGVRLVEIKNLRLLIDSFFVFEKKYPEYKLVISGDGDQKQMLKVLAKDYGLSSKVIFTGNLPNCYYLIKNASLIAVTSFSEALPGIVIEALVLGKNVVSTPNMGSVEILENGKYGFISKSYDDPKEFASLMAKAITEPISKKLIDKRALDFECQTTISKYEELFI